MRTQVEREERRGEENLLLLTTTSLMAATLASSSLSNPSHVSLPSATIPPHHSIGASRSPLRSQHQLPRSPPSGGGFCRASQAVELFPAVHPRVVVRDAQLRDYWEVADTHCSSFFPRHLFPLDMLLKVNRFVGLLSGPSAPPGCTRICLVAVINTVLDNDVSVEGEGPTSDAFEGIFRFSGASIAGILTLDNAGDFLPRRGPSRERRSGIAYISNVAVRKGHRRKGIAKLLVSEAFARAGSWGCRSVALHCDPNDVAAINLYEGQGFKTIKVPEGAKWPEPRSYPGSQFRFMMKRCSSR